MPSYSYHVKFELYPTANPTAEEEANTAGSNIWLPSSDTSVFDELPSHPRADRAFRRLLEPSASTTQSEHSIPLRPAEDYSSSSTPAIIDCGAAPRGPSPQSERKFEIVSERQWLQRQNSSPPPSASAAIRPQTAVRDWRFGQVSIETIFLDTRSSMTGESSKAVPSAAPALGPTYPGAGTDTKALLEILETKNTEVGWGIVHFYRDGIETPTLDWVQEDHPGGEAKEEDCTTLCIPAVPAYMSPEDFVAFLGRGWLDYISHCRMVLTSTMNSFLVLLKFRDNQLAKKCRREFDGKLFNEVERHICHAVFVKSITFATPSQRRPSQNLSSLSSAGISNSLRPFPPPTPNLVELPTCPVCLERMDDTNGLMTIACSHVFHCTCLKSWKGTGCPVCRFTSPSLGELDPSEQPFGSSVANLCSVCDCTDDLWICLICGYVGCGRYKGGHAKDHWKETAHCFALEIQTQHVWDYAGDTWVHRLIRHKGDGKVVELPGRGELNQSQEEEDVVPRAKLESIGLEYTNLLQSQLESQRAYFEELTKKAVDKASAASAAAEEASRRASNMMEKFTALEDKYNMLIKETIPQLERDLERERTKARKSEELARKLSKALQEEKKLNEGLMKRIEHLNTDNEKLVKQETELREEIANEKEMNRDLTMFISGQEKLKELEKEGKIEEGEVEGGTASVPEKKTRRKGKK